MKIRILCFISIMMSYTYSVNAQDFSPVRSLAERRTPWLAQKLSFSTIPKENGKDVFVIQTRNGKIEISATDVNSAAKALGFYLKNYCHRSMSNMGDNLSPVAKLPVVANPIKIVSNAEIRYALNYCTVSYTMAFYKWKDWEHELDWMALNGVNLVLAPIGVEAVWQNTLRRLGYSESEVLKFIAAPAYSAWWLMGNLEGWGGPISQDIINQQRDLQKNILKRMKALGMQPVMQGFYGMVPATLKEKSVSLLEQGKWAGGFQRPAFLRPDNDFKKIAGIYYEEMKRIYGSGFRYFAGDPFHEGGNSGGVNVADYGKLIQSEMQHYFSGSTWVLQGWQNNPSSQLLSQLDKSKVLVLELFGENTDNWYKRKGYEGTPFVWCSVTNFGGKSGLYGKLQRFANEVYRANNGEYASLMKGVGIMPEGIDNNPVVYDFILDLSWHPEKVEVNDWIKTYATARYGAENKKVEEAWQIFLQTVYSSFDKYQEGPGESVFCARPSLDVKSASSWGTRARNYDVEKFKKGVQLFVSASSEMKNSEVFQIDKIDFVRQVLANEGEKVYADMVAAFWKRDVDLFTKQSDLFLSLIQMQDSILSGNKHFQLHTWLQQAEDFGNTPAEKKLALKNGKMQITYWGPDNPSTDLHDYANKEWSGLMKYFYLPRWEMFVKDCMAILEGKPAPKSPDYFEFEKEWTGKPDLYPPMKITSSRQESIIRRILMMD